MTLYEVRQRIPAGQGLMFDLRLDIGDLFITLDEGRFNLKVLCKHGVVYVHANDIEGYCREVK